MLIYKTFLVPLSVSRTLGESAKTITGEWKHSEFDSLESLGDRIKIVQFWTFGCWNCTATIPNLKELYGETSRDEFEIIGVHSPEFAYEKIWDNVEEACEKLGVNWIVVQDNNLKDFRSWQSGGTGYWPRTFILDEANKIVLDKAGEGAYKEINQTVHDLIAKRRKTKT